MTNQLENDLAQNAMDRLHTWIKDTAMRCEIVDMPHDRQMSIIAGCLTHKLIEIWQIIDVKPGEAGRIIYNIYKEWLEIEEKSKQKSKVK
jgi:hypothetical protein